MMIAGGLVVIVSFVWDFRNVMGGGLPNPFNWPLFLVGEALGLTGFLAALKRIQYFGNLEYRSVLDRGRVGAKAAIVDWFQQLLQSHVDVAEGFQNYANLLLANPIRWL